MFPRTFRATSSVVSFWVLVAFASVLLGDALLRGAWSTVVGYLPPVLLALWAFWVLLWRMSVRALPERVVVTNLLRVHDVPWSHVVDIRQGGQVTLELDDSRRVSCWGGPFPAKPGIPRRPLPTQRNSSAPANRPAATFAQTLDAYRHSAPPSMAPVRSHWDLPAIAIGVVLGVAVIVRVLVVAS